jgi:hypothetical protein
MLWLTLNDARFSILLNFSIYVGSLSSTIVQLANRLASLELFIEAVSIDCGTGSSSSDMSMTSIGFLGANLMTETLLSIAGSSTTFVIVVVLSFLATGLANNDVPTLRLRLNFGIVSVKI